MTSFSQLLQSFDVPGPRYTSYPTADRFVEAFGEAQYLQALDLRRHSVRAHAYPLSVYVHIPFCESLCYYCACNKIITGKYARAVQYLKSLRTEVGLLLPHLGTGHAVSQLHFGGGTPTFLRDPELIELMDILGKAFQWKADGEYSVEVDPRTVNAERLATLRQLGFNRLSLGVQDFDPQVQIAVHREQSVQQVQTLMEAGRSLGFKSVNLDLIYGLPKQTTESWKRTLTTVVKLRPERIALYAYAPICLRGSNRSATLIPMTCLSPHRKPRCCPKPFKYCSQKAMSTLAWTTLHCQTILSPSPSGRDAYTATFKAIPPSLTAI